MDWLIDASTSGIHVLQATHLSSFWTFSSSFSFSSSSEMLLQDMMAREMKPITGIVQDPLGFVETAIEIKKI